MRRAVTRLVFVGSLLASSAHADDTANGGDSNALEALLSESVVTTASRTTERASVAPATVYNITGADLLRTGMRTVGEALEFLGLGIYVNTTRDYVSGGDIGAQGILLRDGGQHVLVMLDGAVLNSQGTGRVYVHEGLGVALELVDHVEVMLGPGSVMYGSNAMLGVINIVTKRAKDLHGVVGSFEIGTSAPMDAAGHFTDAAGTHWGERERLSLGFGRRFTLRHTDGEVTAMVEWTRERTNSYAVTPFGRDPTGNQSFAPGQATWGGNATNSLNAPNATVSVVLGHFRLQVNGFYYERSTPLTGTFMDPGSKEQQAGARVDLRHTIDLSAKLSLASHLYGGYASFSEASNYGESFWCIQGQDNGCHFDMRATSGWVGLEQQLAVDWFTNGKVVTTVGYDARVLLFDSHPADYTDLVTGALPSLPLPHETDAEFRGALFLQQVWRPLRWLHLNIGGRLDIDSEFGVKFSPRAAVVFTPTERTTLRLSYNEAFRAPSQYEVSEFDPTFRVTPKHLAPETVRSVEVELQQRVWRLSLSLRGYASFYNDLIDSRPATAAEIAPFASQLSSTVDPSNVVVNANIDALHVFGGSASARLNLPRGFELSYSINLARTEHPNGVVDQRLPLFYGNFRAGWQNARGYSVSVLGVYTGRREVLFNASPVGAPSIGSRVDLRLAAAGPLGHVPGLSWRAALGASVSYQQPYLLAYGAPITGNYVLYPVQTRLFGFVGLRYEWLGL